MSSLKRKDPAIYEKSTTFFEDEAINSNADLEPKKKEKKLTVKQYEQDIILQGGGAFDDDSDEDAQNKRPQSPTYNEEQKMIKNEILGKMGSISDSEGEEDFGGLFSKREKTKKEQVHFVKILSFQVKIQIELKLVSDENLFH